VLIAFGFLFAEYILVATLMHNYHSPQNPRFVFIIVTANEITIATSAPAISSNINIPLPSPLILELAKKLTPVASAVAIMLAA